MVDEEKIALTPAVELYFLKKDEQKDLLVTMESEDATPSLSQAQRMKRLSQSGRLDMDTIFAIMTEEKANQKETLKFSADRTGNKKTACGVANGIEKQINLYGLGRFYAPFPVFRGRYLLMARTVSRPKITVQAVYSGDTDMQELFVSLLVNAVRNGKTSVRTFEIVKDTQYNEDRKQRKEAS